MRPLRLLSLGLVAACTSGAHDASVADSPAAARAVAATPPSPAGGAGALAVLRRAPIELRDGRYTLELERVVNAQRDTTVRALRLVDSLGAVAYAETIVMPPQSEDEWAEVRAVALEDAAGVARAVMVSYGFYPSAPNSGEYFRIIVPRAGKLVALSPMVGYYGDLAPFAEGSRPGSRRLQPRDAMAVSLWQSEFFAEVPIHVDLDCAPGTPACLTLPLPDSVAGLARLRVRASPDTIRDTATVALHRAPGAVAPDSIRVGPGTVVQVLEGAANAAIGGDASQFGVGISNSWLHVRVNGREGWVHGQPAFVALGLPSTG